MFHATTPSLTDATVPLTSSQAEIIRQAAVDVRGQISVTTSRGRGARRLEVARDLVEAGYMERVAAFPERECHRGRAATYLTTVFRATQAGRAALAAN